MKKRVKLGVKPQKVSLLKNLIFFVIFIAILAIGVKFVFQLTTAPITGHWVKDGITYNCSNCSDCNDAIADASAGDIIQLNASISNQVGTCINFDGKDNIIFDCLGNTIDGSNNLAMGIVAGQISQEGINITIRNCNITDFSSGIYFDYNSNSTIINVIINKNAYGIYSSSFSNNNTLTNITSNNNTNYGIYLKDCSNNTLTNITSNSNDNGIRLQNCSSNTLTNITSNSNSHIGLYLDSSSNNIIGNSLFLNNSENDFYLSFNTDADCNNQLENVNGTDNKPIIYSNQTINLANWDNNLSSLILCNADNSIINNITLNNSVNNNNAVLILRTDNASITNLELTNLWQGIYLYNSSNNSLENITSTLNLGDGLSMKYSSNNLIKNILATNNTIGISFTINSDNNTLLNSTTNNNTYGAHLSSSSNNTLTNLTANSNTNYGIYLSSSPGNTFTNITSNSNTNNGIFLLSSSNNNLTKIISNLNQQGLRIWGSSDDNNRITNATFQNNSDFGILFTSSGENELRNVSIILTGNQAGLSSGGYYQTQNDIDTSNTINGRPIQHFDGNYKSCPDNQILDYNNTYSQINFYGCNNVTLYATEIIDGINLWFTNNSRLYNINSSSNYFGIFLYTGSNNTLTNITTNSNQRHGIALSSGSTNNTLTNITANSNDRDGINLDSNSTNNTLTNIISNSNLQRGIYLYSSSNNTLTNITTSSNSLQGIYLTSESNYNIINNSRIENNTQYGIYFYNSSTGYPQYNTVYNNFFNNTVNYYNNTNLTNYFNTTNTSGTNIIGGSYVGGNFWAYPNGSGFSQTCTDANSDGFCDSAYNVDGVSQSYDYLPLYSASLGCTESWTCTAWSSCVSSVQTRTCTDQNSCGTTTSKPPESQSCTGPSTGGGIVAGQPTQTHTWTTITANEPATMTITNPQMDLTTITITTTETVIGASLTVTKIDVLPQADIEIGLPSGNSYQAFKIDTSGINDTNIANATIEFKVNKSWIDSQGTADQISLYRKPGQANKWDALETTLTGSDDQYYYFSAVSPGFSSFVVFIDLSQCAPGDIRCFNKEIQLCLGNYTWVVTKKCEYGCDGNECARGEGIGIIDTGSIVVYVIITVISAGILVILYFMFRYFSKKHAQEVWKKSQMRRK